VTFVLRPLSFDERRGDQSNRVDVAIRYPLVTLRPEYADAAQAKYEVHYENVSKELRRKGGQSRVAEAKVRDENLLGNLGEQAMRQFLWMPPGLPIENCSRHDVGPFDVKTGRFYTYGAKTHGAIGFDNKPETGGMHGSCLMIPEEQPPEGKDMYAYVQQLPAPLAGGYVMCGYLKASDARRLGVKTSYREDGDCLEVSHHHLTQMPADPPWRMKRCPWMP